MGVDDGGMPDQPQLQAMPVAHMRWSSLPTCQYIADATEYLGELNLVTRELVWNDGDTWDMVEDRQQ